MLKIFTDLSIRDTQINEYFFEAKDCPKIKSVFKANDRGGGNEPELIEYVCLEFLCSALNIFTEVLM